MKLLVTVCLALLALGNAAHAADAGEWKLRAGPYLVDPKSDNSDVATVDDGVSLGFNFTYFFSPNVAIEVLAATPFSHDVNLAADGSQVGETKHLPPTVSLQYHFDTEGTFDPYVGVGLNYTIFFEEETSGALAGTDLDLDDSFGLALQAGADFELSDNWFLNLDIRWIDIDTDATLDGAALTTVEIDPLVAGATIGYRFK